VKRFLRLCIVTIINSSLIFLPLANVNAAENLALPSGDLVAPEIKSPQINKQLAAGESVTIHASVTDNVGVKNVTLFYRHVGAADFKRVEMSRKLPTDNYSATLPEITEPGIEYYIQATDLAGNTILHGHTFSPLTIAVASDGIAPQAEIDEVVSLVPVSEDGAPAKKGISKWVWIGLGVLLVGAAAGGGGGGGGGAPAATTGTVTITGAAP